MSEQRAESGEVVAERERIADQCRKWAVERFDEFGPHDARGAALWDVATWLQLNALVTMHRTARYAAYDTPTLDRAAEHGCLGENVETGDPTVCGSCASTPPESPTAPTRGDDQ